MHGCVKENNQGILFYHPANECPVRDALHDLQNRDIFFYLNTPTLPFFSIKIKLQAWILRKMQHPAASLIRYSKAYTKWP